jgi:hypothetical protein
LEADMEDFDLDFDADLEDLDDADADLAGVEESLASLDRRGGVEAAFRAAVREELGEDY